MKNKKRYIIKKYVIASSVKEALKLEPKSHVDEVLFDKDLNDVNVGFTNEGGRRTE